MNLSAAYALGFSGSRLALLVWWHWKPTSFQSPYCCKWGFPYGMTGLIWVVLTSLLFHGECLVFILAPWGAGKRLQNSSLHQPFLSSRVSLNLIDMSNEKCFFNLERRIERKKKRIFSAVSGAGFLIPLAWSTETHSLLISIPEVCRWKITSLTGKTCSETLLPKGLKGCGCICKSQQVPVALLYLAGNPLEAFSSKTMLCLIGSREEHSIHSI